MNLIKKYFVFIAPALIFFSQNSTAQNVGIGLITPLTKLHVQNGVSGAAPYSLASLTVESNDHTFINLLSPAAKETGILFGIPGFPYDGAIDYNNVNTLNGLQFRTNGNQTRMVINSAGNVGIGTASPTALLSLASTGTELAGTAMSNTFRTNAGTLGTGTGNEINIASLGFLGGNNIALGIRGYRNSNGSDWTNTSILLGYDVDNTVRPASFFAMGSNGNFGFGVADPAASAKLDVTSTTKGFLPPRMTTTQRDAIASPVPGLMIFNSTTQTIDFYTQYGWSSIKSGIGGANKLLGGNNQEALPCMQKTSDGGYIVVGTSTSSANGDVTGTTHDNLGLGLGGEIWVVKLTATGTISWNKLLGGDLEESGYNIQQTTDGGYIVAGSSTSSANGNVTGVNHGGADYWIVKLDGSGNIVWNKLIGGSGNDKAYSIQQTSDGGYVVAGESTSSANGDVTEINHGSGSPIDYWIVKLDGTGNIMWNRLLGGNGIEIARSVLEAAAGGFIVAGSSTSSANGNVTPVNHGNTDYWIVKLDAAGAISWNRLLGGTSDEEAFSIRQNTIDGAYLIAGYSQSSANGDVTGTNHYAASKEFWIVRLDVGGAAILWNKLLGGDQFEEPNSIVQTTDGGYIVAGYSGSSAQGDVTLANHGGQDYWIVKLDRFGNITWNKLIGGSGTDIAYSVQQAGDGSYIVIGTSTSSSNGDVIPANHGLKDYWVIRLDANGNPL
ncbi:MAG: hypothetical protein ABIR78_08970 [Ferruginibacter sp.]